VFDASGLARKFHHTNIANFFAVDYLLIAYNH